MSEEPKKEEIKPKEECPKKEGCHGFHGFGPRCHWRGPMGPGMHPHKHKERKCECGEIIPKRKEGEPKIKVCPKCGKDLPKKQHGFGMRCHKMRKFMKYMFMMNMMNTWGGPFGFGFGPRFNRFGAPSPYRGFDVHHYIHFGPPMHPPCFGRPPMGPFGFGRPPMHLDSADHQWVHLDLVELLWDLGVHLLELMVITVGHMDLAKRKMKRRNK